MSVACPSSSSHWSSACLHCRALLHAHLYCHAVKVASSVSCTMRSRVVTHSVYCRAVEVVSSDTSRVVLSVHYCAIEVAHPVSCPTIEVVSSDSRRAIKVARSVHCPPVRLHALFQVAPPRRTLSLSSCCRGCALKFILAPSRPRAQLIVAHPPSSLHPLCSYLHPHPRRAFILIIVSSHSLLRPSRDRLLALSCAQLHCAIMRSTSSLHCAYLCTF